MADGSKIEWTEATWNPITGCSVTSPGCKRCYAMLLAGTRLARHWSRAGLTQDTKAGPVWTGEVRFNEQWLDQPLRWKRPRMIFVCAHGDLFHESVPDEWIDRVFAVMALCPQHTFQVLTKRSARMREYFARYDAAHDDNCADMVARAVEGMAISDLAQSVADTSLARWPLPNVWLGVSVEDQQRADERIPDLLATPAAVRWLSCEPLLGPVDVRQWLHDYGCSACGYGGAVHERCRECGWHGDCSHQAGPCPACGKLLQDDYACPECGEEDGEGDFGPTISGHRLGLIDWIVTGGESGPGARPMHPDWARSLRDQCAAAGVPFFFKQWGEWHPSDQHDDCEMKSIMAFRDDHSQEWRPSEAWGWAIPSRSGWQGMCKIGKKRAGRLLDGVEHNGWPYA